MEISQTQNDHALTSRQQASVSVDVKNAGKLFLRTEEGDQVTLSLRASAGLSRSASQTSFADGSRQETFSAEARAAFEYSLTVQGDLNEEELAAIQELAGRVSTIAEDFFSGEEFDVFASAESLSQSLGVIDEIELSLQQTVTTTFSAASLVRGAQGEGAQSAPEVSGGNDGAGIRDLAALAGAVVESVFQEQGRAFAESETLARSLNDLAQLLRERLLEFLNPLKQLAAHGSEETKSSQETGGPDSKVETAPTPNEVASPPPTEEV